MNIYAIADLHLSFHENIDKPMVIFGEGWKHYEDKLERYWRERVKPEDLVLIPGDISWGLKFEEAKPDLDWIHELPGQKILLKGNHDLWWSRIQYLNTLYDDMFFMQNDCYYISSDRTGDVNTAICGTRGWILPDSDDFKKHDQKVYTRELGRLKNSLDAAMRQGAERIIVAMHYPPADDAKHSSEFTELMQQYPVTDCVYGHLHGMPAFTKGIKGKYDGILYRLVSLDYLGAKPTQIER